MSEMAKTARAAMKSKAKSLTTADPHQKVDSSTWTPPEAENAGVKTGLRPLSRRAYKKGGKVMGEPCKANMGRTPRKSGGEVKKWVDAKVNRNVKDANEQREGIKHVGALKSGGRAKKMLGGPMMGGGMMAPVALPMSGVVPASGGAAPAPAMTGGPNVNPKALYGGPIGGSPYNKGGKVEHDDESADKALIKKMVKPSARTGKADGGESDDGMKKGGRAHRATGGGIFSGPGYPGKVPGATGGRTAHARGGKTGKSHIHININAGSKPPGMDAMGMPMPGAPGGDPMGGLVKPPGMGGPAGGAPMPVGAMPPGMPPMPPGMPSGAPPVPPGMRPMARKSGGRTYRSYKDMDAGAGGGEGRLEKTEIAKRKTGIQKA